MTFEYRDQYSGYINAGVFLNRALVIKTNPHGCFVDPARVEEVVAGIRDAARTAGAHTAKPVGCRSTQHCAAHDFCHRCTPSLDDAVRHLVKAISAAGITTGSGDVYAQLAATIRDAARTAARQTTPHACDNCDGVDPASCLANPGRAARQTTGQDDTKPHVHRLGNSDEDGGLMDDWDNCRDPNCPGPSAQEREAALAKRGLAAPAVGQPDPAVVEQFIQHMANEHPAATHCCTNCDGIDPDTCLTNPHRAPAVGQPAEAHDTEAHPADVTWTVEKRGDTDWLVASTHYDDRDKALTRLARRREQYPDTEFRIVRETTTWTVEADR